jgi:hypothetical protein
MTKRSELTPLEYTAPLAAEQTFSQCHKFEVRGIREVHPWDTWSVRFSNQHCADATVAWLTKMGYFARIV